MSSLIRANLLGRLNGATLVCVLGVTLIAGACSASRSSSATPRTTTTNLLFELGASPFLGLSPYDDKALVDRIGAQICSDLRSGFSVSQIVTQVLAEVTQPRYNAPTADDAHATMVVAVNDICPDQRSTLEHLESPSS